MAGDKLSNSVLVVDDFAESLRLLTAILRRGGLVPRPVVSGRLAIEAASFDPPDLVLLDFRMPGMTGPEVCRWFKQDERLKDIPIICISGLQGTEQKVEAFRAGAVDYISKPFREEEVLARVNVHLQLRRSQRELAKYNEQLTRLVAKQVESVSDMQFAIIFALATLAEARDDATGRHLERVQMYSSLMAGHLRDVGRYVAILDPAFAECLHHAASLHDIGKVATPDAILLKAGTLTPEEFAEMKEHCRLGADTLARVVERHPDNQFARMGVAIARSHHEHWDGSGYPDGLKGEAIPLAARIVALADFYDALTSDRRYRPAFSHEDACRMIAAGSGTHFDPEVVAAFSAHKNQFRRIQREMRDWIGVAAVAGGALLPSEMPA